MCELKEVDRVCEVIKGKEQRVNLLVQTQGNMNLRGRDGKLFYDVNNHVYEHTLTLNLESPEGLDRKFTLNYYSRMRFTSNLLPLLRPTPSTSHPQFSRVLSVLAGGHEASINLSDISLKTSFSVANCAAHSITMNSLMVTEFASRNPGISFAHSHPAFVSTSLARELPIWARLPMKGLTPLLRPWSVSVEETGERQLFIATSGLFAPREGVPGAKIPKGSEIVKGADGVNGSGGYIVNWDGEVVGKPIVKKYIEEGLGETVWEHTMRTFEEVAKINKGRN